jgi:Ca2+-binding RTX toxin-like protein
MLVVAGSTTSDINVGNGASLIFAGSGSTSVTGGTGSLQVVVGSGRGSFTEGEGATSFDVVKGAAGGTDMLSGFKPGTDKIDLFGYGAAAPTISVSAGSTLITLSDGTNLELVGVTNLGNSIVNS